MCNPKLNTMKNQLRIFLLLPFLAFLIFSSCQEEVVDVAQPDENESLVADSALTSLISSASLMDGSADNIIDQASCLSIELPVTVKIRGLEIIIESKEGFKKIEAIYDEFDDDDDRLDIVFPIKIILSDYEEVVIADRQAMDELITDCKDENEEDDDIECIDFQYPISFSVYNANFQVINVVNIENDKELNRFIKRVKNVEVFASLNFPATMKLADGTEVIVNNNEELETTIDSAKNTCDEDDDNDHNDDDFTKEHLDEYLKICPWVVYEFKRNNQDNTAQYGEYALNFKEDDIVKMRSKNGDLLTGTWSTRISNRGALLKMNFETLADFTLEWLVYDIEYGKIRIFESSENKIILEKNCDIDLTPKESQNEEVKGYLSNCIWRIESLSVAGNSFEDNYIGMALNFYSDNSFLLQRKFSEPGNYTVHYNDNQETILKITLDSQNSRLNLEKEWIVASATSAKVVLESGDNRMVLNNHCKQDQEANRLKISDGEWAVALYNDNEVNKTQDYTSYVFNFSFSGHIILKDDNDNLELGSWLIYKEEKLQFDLNLQTDEAPLSILRHRWRLVEIQEDRIELKDFDNNGGVKRTLVLEKLEK